MKAMILAAGLGTRLRPLTDDRPKALVKINGRTLLQVTIERLAASGVREIIVNVHHFADKVADYLKSHNNFGLLIEISREDDLLLDTGGGLKKAAWFFLEGSERNDEPFLLHNVDVISDINFTRMLENHALATLAMQERKSSRQLLFDDDLQLIGRRVDGNDEMAAQSAASITSSETRKPSSASPLVYPESRRATSHSPLLPLAFSGIHILSPRIFPLLTESTPAFSIIDSYLRLAAQGHKILAFRHDGSYWRDLGRPADLAQAARDLH